MTYQKPEIEVVSLVNEDITTSGSIIGGQTGTGEGSVNWDE